MAAATKGETDPASRAAMRRVVEELFDVPAVLLRKKPLAALSGLEWVVGSVVMNMVSVAVNSRWADNGRKVASVMYLRDTRAFVTTMLGQMSLTVVYQIANSAAWWMRTRIGIAWRKRLTERLHEVHFADMTFYRQTTWGAESIPDPAQRIASDVAVLIGTSGSYEGLTMLLQSWISTTIGAVNAVWRMWFQMPDQRWLLPFIFLWSYGNLTFRNWFAPAMMRATLLAEGSKISGAYRDAQSKLSQHAEQIISFDGVAAERRRILSKLKESLANSHQLTLVYLRENLAMNLVLTPAICKQRVIQTFLSRVSPDSGWFNETCLLVGAGGRGLLSHDDPCAHSLFDDCGIVVSRAVIYNTPIITIHECSKQDRYTGEL